MNMEPQGSQLGDVGDVLNTGGRTGASEADILALRAVSAFSWPDVLARLSNALYVQGFAVWSEIDLAHMRPVRSLASPPQRRLIIIGHPQLSRRALSIDDSAGLDLTLTLHLHRDDRGHIHVHCQDPRQVWGRAAPDRLQPIITTLADRLHLVLNAL